MRPSLAPLSCLSGALGLLVVQAPSAAAPSCPATSFEADAAVRSHWPELPAQVREAFEGRQDIDECASVHLRYVEGAIALDVALPDGRSTSRIAQRDDVLAGLEALLLVPKIAPPPPPKTDDVGTTHLESTVIEVSGLSRPALDRGPGTSAPGAPPSGLRVELSMDLGLHRGDGQTRTSIGASSLLDAAGWLVGFGGRIERYSGAEIDDGDSPKALEMGVLAGRRFRGRSLALDVLAGPAFAVRGGSDVSMANTAAQGMVSTMTSISRSEGLVPRLLLGSRLTVGARSYVRSFVSVDGEVGDSGPTPPGSSRGLPHWLLGVSIGATVGTL
jgi:hypothetical protein